MTIPYGQGFDEKRHGTVGVYNISTFAVQFPNTAIQYYGNAWTNGGMNSTGIVATRLIALEKLRLAMIEALTEKQFLSEQGKPYWQAQIDAFTNWNPEEA